MFRFHIEAQDLDAILSQLKVKQVSSDSLDDPRDFFHISGYLPMGDGVHYYQGKDKFGEIITIKCSADHSRAVFRVSHAIQQNRNEVADGKK